MLAGTTKRHVSWVVAITEVFYSLVTDGHPIQFRDYAIVSARWYELFFLSGNRLILDGVGGGGHVVITEEGIAYRSAPGERKRPSIVGGSLTPTELECGFGWWVRGWAQRHRRTALRSHRRADASTPCIRARPDVARTAGAKQPRAALETYTACPARVDCCDAPGAVMRPSFAATPTQEPRTFSENSSR